MTRRAVAKCPHGVPLRAPGRARFGRVRCYACDPLPVATPAPLPSGAFDGCDGCDGCRPRPVRQGRPVLSVIATGTPWGAEIATPCPVCRVPLRDHP